MDENGKSELENKYARLQTRAFSIVIEIIFIFGLPALLAVWIGGLLSDEKTTTYILLAIAFILSWVILFLRIKAINTRLKEMQERLQKEKQEKK